MTRRGPEPTLQARTAPKLKGITFLHLRDYVAKHHGEQAVRQVAAALSPEANKAFDWPAAHEWYPLPLFVEAERKVVDLLYGGDYREAFRFGQYDLEVSLGTVYRFLLRAMTATFLIERAAKLWTTFMDGGRIEVRRVGDKAIQVKVSELNPGHVVYCNDLRGSFAGALEVCGAKDVKAVQSTCVCEGASECTFDITWS